MKPSLRISILTRDRYACLYCGRRAPNVDLHVDHIISVRDGGSNHPSNLATACRECNLGKSSRSLIVDKESTTMCGDNQIADACSFLNFKIDDTPIAQVAQAQRFTPEPITERFAGLLLAVDDAHWKALRRHWREESIEMLADDSPTQEEYIESYWSDADSRTGTA